MSNYLDNLQSWDHQENETPSSYEYFLDYRNMGPTRSHTKIAAKYGVTPGNISQIAAKNNWTERLNAYLVHMEQIRQEESEIAIRDMCQRHAQDNMSISVGQMAFVRDFLKRLNRGIINFDDMTDAARLKFLNEIGNVMPKVQSAERLARGEATQISAHDHTSGGETIKVVLPIAEPAEAFDAMGDDQENLTDD